jgi:hypothetical protein
MKRILVGKAYLAMNTRTFIVASFDCVSSISASTLSQKKDASEQIQSDILLKSKL